MDGEERRNTGTVTEDGKCSCGDVEERSRNVGTVTQRGLGV